MQPIRAGALHLLHLEAAATIFQHPAHSTPGIQGCVGSEVFASTLEVAVTARLYPAQHVKRPSACSLDGDKLAPLSTLHGPGQESGWAVSQASCPLPFEVAAIILSRTMMSTLQLRLRVLGCVSETSISLRWSVKDLWKGTYGWQWSETGSVPEWVRTLWPYKRPGFAFTSFQEASI